jgi:hypothetical protein
MTSFKHFLTESYKNLFSAEDKEKYADQAYDQLIASYAKIGGLKGSGFEDKESFIKNIPFWKLNISNGKIIAAAYYKDNNGRKRVAISSDGSDSGKKAVADIMMSDFTKNRAYAEQSGPSLGFLVKQIGYEAIKKLAIPLDKVDKIVKDPTKPPSDDKEMVRHPELKDYFYQRIIDGKPYTKIAIGTTGKQIEL